MNTLFCIVGQTCSGKDSLVNELIKNHPDKFKAVCSYTDRPKRDTETEGIEHHFLSYDEFNELVKTHELIAYTEINGRQYAATKDQLEYSNVYIIDPVGVDYIQKNFPDIKTFQIVIVSPFEDRYERSMKNRSDFQLAFKNRVESEEEQFSNYMEKCTYDELIYNENNKFKESYERFEKIMLDKYNEDISADD